MALLARIRPTFVAVIAAGLLVTPALAQTARPNQTTATYGNWVLRCLIAQGQPASKTCEVFQQVQAVKDGQTVTLLNVAVGRGQPTLPIRVTVVTPPDISIATGARIRFSEKTTTELVFERCLGGACYASSNTTEEFFQAMRGPTEGVRVEYKSGLNTDVAVPISLEGFAEAIAALQEEERKR